MNQQTSQGKKSDWYDIFEKIKVKFKDPMEDSGKMAQ